MSKARQLRTLLRERAYLTTPGITTALHAMIVEQAGFEYVYAGGYDASLTLLGEPDVGLMTETEMVANLRNVAKATSLPVVADADTGYGNAVNVIRTVQDYEAAGVAAMHIEDQVAPKRCGHVAGKMVVPLEEAVGKIRAALDARRDPDFVIIARTDAVAAAGGGFDEAVRRGKAYARAGADMVWAEFPSADPELPRRFAEAIHSDFPSLPLYFNYSSNLKWYESGVSFEALAAMGYKLMHVSLVAMRVMMHAFWDYAVAMKAHGAQAEIDFQKRLAGHPMGAFHELAGFPRVKALEETYLPAEEVRQKYSGSVGL
ncbi:MAG TPA: isocitrate lyase/PEP mutase family protein [Burkholderiales bacterium]|nr:isocitrate lyase/PEP mutase family protein [Burkholderiales bacterium]